MKRTVEALVWLTAIALFAFAGRAVFAAAGGADAMRDAAQEARGGRRDGGEGETRDGREEARRPRRREADPAAVMRAARTLYVRPTRHLDKKYLEYKLGKHRELADWGLALVAEESAADLVLTIDKTALNYIFTITDPRTSVIVATGKTVAINGLVAAENLGRGIIRKIRDVRASPDDGGRRRRRPRDDGRGEDAWSESSEALAEEPHEAENPVRGPAPSGPLARGGARADSAARPHVRGRRAALHR